MRAVAFAALACLGISGLAGTPATSQSLGVVQSDILVLDPDRLFSQTRFGKRLNAQYLEQRDELIARNRRLETELESEEKALADLRTETTPEEFRALADAFDSKVQEIRRESDRAVRELERNRESAPVLFMRTVEPVLIEIMQEADGAIVLDIRSVLLRSNQVDITDLAIARIDQKIGDGPELPPSPEPETQAPD